jgi:diguanylate cyclase (GGDEF)-like protein
MPSAPTAAKTPRRPSRPSQTQERVIVSGVVVALFVAFVAFLGAQFGPLALVLAVPAGVLGGYVARSLQARQHGLRLLTQQDALTGLGNRRLLHERLNYEITRHRRMSRRFSVLALDLDGFKQVNDRYGHPAGDEILREVARSLRRAVRDQDTVVRMGGDEFCVLVPESSWKEAERMSERLQQAVAGCVGGLDTLGASVGYAIFPDEGWAPEHLLGRADAAAIEMKRRRRDGGQLRAA